VDFAKCLPIICLLVSGCTTTAYMDRHTMNNMVIDCTMSKEQIAFIESQKPSDDDSFINSMMIRSWLGYFASNSDGTYNNRRDWNNGARTNAVRLQVYNIQKTCTK